MTLYDEASFYNVYREYEDWGSFVMGRFCSYVCKRGFCSRKIDAGICGGSFILEVFTVSNDMLEGTKCTKKVEKS